MIEVIHRPEREAHIALGVDVVERIPPGFLRVAHIDEVIDDDDHFCQAHEAGAPEPVHHLEGVTGILLPDADEHEVVEDAFRGHVIIHNLRHRHLDERQEDPFRGAAQVEIFHGRAADDRRRIQRILAQRHGLDVE